MKYLLLTGLLGILWAYLNMYQLEVTILDVGMDKVETAVENAAHDAALQIDENELLNDKVIFVKNEADITFKNTMMANLKVDTALKPINSALIDGPIKLLDVQYIDHGYKDPFTNKFVNFPYIYTYNGVNRFERTVFGPSIAYVIEANFYKNNSPHQFVVIQEYKK
ncbi:hypothetical protein IHV12_19675 [Fictibacillus sp. 7GRE50]|uniref:hypothetical protein n=1 Tax=Fictibacillus sp. 7GRE50 TaxID=2745878 RepID=UPI0018CFB444|nr:hypothetical protein [Fictibacillus sp. 7GRE50]MBH0167148.1 hypothetical protein [Fictibacillus sp. 7GRE50]